MGHDYQRIDVAVSYLNPGDSPWWDERVMLDCHFYEPEEFSHCHECGNKSWPGTYTNKVRGEKYWNKAFLDTVFKPVWDFKEEHDILVHFSEMGAKADLDDDVRASYLSDIISVFQTHGTGWTVWEWNEKRFGIHDCQPVIQTVFRDIEVKNTQPRNFPVSKRTSAKTIEKAWYSINGRRIFNLSDRVPQSTGIYLIHTESSHSSFLKRQVIKP
jgi:hypothetical protein